MKTVEVLQMNKTNNDKVGKREKQIKLSPKRSPHSGDINLHSDYNDRRNFVSYVKKQRVLPSQNKNSTTSPLGSRKDTSTARPKQVPSWNMTKSANRPVAD